MSKQRTLGELVRSKRDELLMTQQQVATAAGVSKQYVSQLESGAVKNPSAKVVAGLMVALRLSASELIEAGKVGGF